MQLKKKAAVVVAAATLFSGLGVIGATTAGAAQPCDPVTRFEDNSSAVGVMMATYNLKASPAAECTTVGSMTNQQQVNIWCYVNNYYGNRWYYISAGSKHGWMSASNMRVTGDSYPC